MDVNRVLEAYRKGDEDKRISLFLYHRDMRSEFSRIEHAHKAAQSPVRGAQKWLKRITGYF